MTENEEKLLAEFEWRMRRLMEFCDELKQENAGLWQDVAQKNIRIEELESEVGKLNSKYENLKFAKSFTSDTDDSDTQQARKRLAKLVRDVDKCIALLKN